MILRLEHFIDEKGRQVVAKHTICGEPGSRAVTFHGTGVLHYELNGVKHQTPFEFLIPGETVDKAYEAFDEAFNTAAYNANEELKAKFSKPSILLPNFMPKRPKLELNEKN